MGSLYRLAAVLFGIGITLHDLEEAVYWPGWVRSHLNVFFEPNPKIYWVGTSLVSVAIWVAIVGACVSPENSHFQSILSGIALAAAVNAVFPHLALSVAKHTYAPGTATGMLFNLPLGVFLLLEQLSAVTTSHAQFWRDAVLYAVLLAADTFGCLFAAHAIEAARKP